MDAAAATPARNQTIQNLFFYMKINIFNENIFLKKDLGLLPGFAGLLGAGERRKCSSRFICWSYALV